MLTQALDHEHSCWKQPEANADTWNEAILATSFSRFGRKLNGMMGWDSERLTTADGGSNGKTSRTVKHDGCCVKE